jgi:hypothetical protein
VASRPEVAFSQQSANISTSCVGCDIRSSSPQPMEKKTLTPRRDIVLLDGYNTPGARELYMICTEDITPAASCLVREKARRLRSFRVHFIPQDTRGSRMHVPVDWARRRKAFLRGSKCVRPLQHRALETRSPRLFRGSQPENSCSRSFPMLGREITHWSLEESSEEVSDFT